MSKKLWTLIAILIVIYLITINLRKSPSSALNSNIEDYQTTQDSAIILAYSNWVGWWPWAIAESEGLFARHNIKVELKWYDNYSDSLTDLAKGVVDANCQTLNDTISFASKATKGEVVVLVNDNSAGNDKIIAANTISNIQDLKNKKVLVEAGVVDDYLLSLALEKEGMKRSDVQIVDVETGAAVAAFASGVGDAVGAFPPFWLEALNRSGSHEIISSKDFPGAIPDLLVVTQDLNDNHPDQVQALVDTWFDILKFMESNPDEADEILANRVGVNQEELDLFKQETCCEINKNSNSWS